MRSAPLRDRLILWRWYLWPPYHLRLSNRLSKGGWPCAPGPSISPLSVGFPPSEYLSGPLSRSPAAVQSLICDGFRIREEPEVTHLFPCVRDRLAQDVGRSVAVSVDNRAVRAAVKPPLYPLSGKTQLFLIPASRTQGSHLWKSHPPLMYRILPG